MAICRGIEHVGVTVPDIEAATGYFAEAFGASVLYDHMPLGTSPWCGDAPEQQLGVPVGTCVLAVRMLRMPDGPNVELFQYTVAGQRSSARPCDLGLQHLALYVDDIDIACDRVRSAGGEILLGPRPFQLEMEAGPGNRWCYTRTPWGMTVELMTFPAPQGYEAHTAIRRWRPRRQT
jgi:catechol 2,3-dioxygenase-like lactoylglutathione lyase family enzyme